MITIDYPTWDHAPFEELDAWVRQQLMRDDVTQIHVQYQERNVPLLYALMERLHNAREDDGMMDRPRTCPEPQAYALINALLGKGASWTQCLDNVSPRLWDGRAEWWGNNDLNDPVSTLNNRFAIRQSPTSFEEVVRQTIDVDVGLAVACMTDRDILNDYMQHSNMWCQRVHPLLAVSNTLDVLRGQLRLVKNQPHEEPLWKHSVQWLENEVGRHNVEFLQLGSGANTTLKREWAQIGDEQGLAFAQSRGWGFDFPMLQDTWNMFVVSRSQPWAHKVEGRYRACLNILIPQIMPHHLSDDEQYFSWRALVSHASQHVQSQDTLTALYDAGFDFEHNIGNKGSIKNYLLHEHPEAWAMLEQHILQQSIIPNEAPDTPSVRKKM